MDNSTIVEILLALLSVVIGVTSYLGANRASKAQAEGVTADIDAQAYQRAREIYESAIDELEKHVNRLKAQMEILGTEVTKLQTSNADLHYTNIKLNMQVRELQASNQDLERQLNSIRTRMDNYGNGEGTAQH